MGQRSRVEWFCDGCGYASDNKADFEYYVMRKVGKSKGKEVKVDLCKDCRAPIEQLWPKAKVRVPRTRQVQLRSVPSNT